MSKINEYRRAQAKEYKLNQEQHYLMPNSQGDYEAGFDACMDLRIGEKFAEWLKANCTINEDYNDRKWFYYHHVDYPEKRFWTSQELYDYYIENIFQP